MRTQSSRCFLPLLILSAILFQSCGNIDIVKRRYRPGFHVEMTKKKDAKNVGETAFVNTMKPNSDLSGVESAELHQQEFEETSPKMAYSDLTTASIDKQKPSVTSKKLSELMIAPFREIKAEKLNGELRRAVFNKKEEEPKFGWSGISFASMGLGTVALALMITGIVFLALLIFGGSFAYWWIFTLVGFFLGIAGMVTGIIGLRETGAGEKRGRGFALAGMLGGIVSMAGGLITAFWGLIYFVINGGDKEDF
ncbi:MAG: hypothetical protein H6601_00465 [Flavobacteriales bacterium]|nr:hypothetical protein [Flavobacteriales bacterium]